MSRSVEFELNLVKANITRTSLHKSKSASRGNRGRKAEEKEKEIEITIQGLFAICVEKLAILFGNVFIDLITTIRIQIDLHKTIHLLDLRFS